MTAHAEHSSGPNGRIFVGPAGWSYPDWAGIVYPAHHSHEFHEATYLAQFFDAIEINTSFYQPLRPALAAQWVERVAAHPRFQFTAKLWQKFTHETGATTADEEAMRAGFAPLAAAGKLAAVLLQFPYSFHRTAENIAHLKNLVERFQSYPLVVEIRHSSWNDPEFYALLEEHHVGFCNIDQPVIGRSIQPSERATAAVGYVRPRKLARHSKKLFVIANNHFEGKSIVNALQLIHLLTNAKVHVPEPLRHRYPQLEAIADAPAEEPTLFPNPPR